jgi:hypothetical protein
MYKQSALVFSVATLLLAAVCDAQHPASRGNVSITGRVVTVDGHSVENARVELRDALGGSSLQSTYTNPSGRFEMSNVAPGRYVVVATGRAG